MLISHQHRFMFFHVPKTGGKSITRALLPHVHLGVRFGNPFSQWLLRRTVEAHRDALTDATGTSEGSLEAVSRVISRAARWENRLSMRRRHALYYASGLQYMLREAPAAFLASYDRTSDCPTARPLSLVHAHESVASYRRHLPREMFDSYFKFAFVREPFEWIQSWYYFLKKIWASGMSDAQMEQFESISFQMLAWRESSLEEFVDAVCTQPAVLATINGGSGTPLLGPLSDEDGNLLVDYVGKQERLSDDFGFVCDRIGISAELPTLNARSTQEAEPAHEELRIRVREAFAGVYRALEYA